MASGQSLGSPAGLPLQGTGAQWDMDSAWSCMEALREGTMNGSGPCCHGSVCTGAGVQEWPAHLHQGFLAGREVAVG